MAVPTNRQEFIDLVMRRLGAPVQQINVDEEQVEDRIDEALSYYRDYHYDATERIFLKHEITPQDITDQAIALDESIIGVVKIIGNVGISAANWMSPMYQISVDAAWSMAEGGGGLSYFMAMSNVAEMQFMFDNTPGIQFQRHTNKLMLNSNWSLMIPGQYIIIQCVRYIDPDAYTDLWSDRWLQRYATALVKKQWGENIKTFSGISLLNGVMLDGQTIWQEADAEISNLEDEMITSYSYPVMDDIG